jgi:hypothetical protein
MSWVTKLWPITLCYTARGHLVNDTYTYYINCTIMLEVRYTTCGPCSSVGIATGYGLGGPGIETRWGRDFPHLSRPPTQPPVQWVPGLPRG